MSRHSRQQANRYVGEGEVDLWALGTRRINGNGPHEFDLGGRYNGPGSGIYGSSFGGGWSMSVSSHTQNENMYQGQRYEQAHEAAG